MRRGDRGQLRITWLDQDGDQRLNVRLWQRDFGGEFWPVRGVGFSLNAKQLPDFADAIATALELANGEVT